MSHNKFKGYCLTCPVRNKSIFSDIPESSLDKTIKDFHTAVVSYDVGETIFYQHDDSSKSAYTLRKGLIKITKGLPDGRVQIVRILMAGELFGFDGFANESYNHSAIALTKVEVCRLPLKDLSKLRQSYKEIDASIMARFIKNLRQSEDMMLELGAKKASERLASFILNLTQADIRQGVNHFEDAQWLDLPLSRSDIGALLGLTIETVSRFFSDWKRKGYIKESKGTLKLIDPKGLKAAACSGGSCE